MADAGWPVSKWGTPTKKVPDTFSGLDSPSDSLTVAHKGGLGRPPPRPLPGNPVNRSPYHRGTTFLSNPLILLALAGCAVAPKPVPIERTEWQPAAGFQGTRLQTPHYDLRLTARDPVLQAYLPGFLETALDAYRQLVPGPCDQRMEIYLFETRAEWARFTRRFAPADAHVYLHIQEGAYMDQRTATTVAYDLGRDRTLALLAHEGLHQYLAACLPEPVVPWLNEGLATQFEAFTLKQGRPVFTARHNLFRRNNLREALDGQGSWIPLSQLLSMHAGQAVVQTGQIARGYYAQVWALVLFLREGPYARDFQHLLRDLGTDRMRLATRAYRAAHPEASALSEGEVVFRHYITDQLNEADQACRAFAHRLVR